MLQAFISLSSFYSLSIITDRQFSKFSTVYNVISLLNYFFAINKNETRKSIKVRMPGRRFENALVQNYSRKEDFLNVKLRTAKLE